MVKKINLHLNLTRRIVLYLTEIKYDNMTNISKFTNIHKDNVLSILNHLQSLGIVIKFNHTNIKFGWSTTKYYALTKNWIEINQKCFPIWT